VARCVDGARARPPKDVGGPHGYAGFLESLADRRHPEHADYKRWVGGHFDPEWFDLTLSIEMYAGRSRPIARSDSNNRALVAWHAHRRKRDVRRANDVLLRIAGPLERYLFADGIGASG
jgi:hypothetical protein